MSSPGRSSSKILRRSTKKPPLMRTSADCIGSIERTSRPRPRRRRGSWSRGRTDRKQSGLARRAKRVDHLVERRVGEPVAVGAEEDLVVAEVRPRRAQSRSPIVAWMPVSRNVMRQSSMSLVEELHLAPPASTKSFASASLYVEEVLLDDLGPVAEAEDEVVVPPRRIPLHDVPEDRLTADRDHRLRDPLGRLAHADAHPAAEDDDLHAPLPSPCKRPQYAHTIHANGRLSTPDRAAGLEDGRVRDRDDQLRRPTRARIRAAPRSRRSGSTAGRRCSRAASRRSARADRSGCACPGVKKPVLVRDCGRPCSRGGRCGSRSS